MTALTERMAQEAQWTLRTFISELAAKHHREYAPNYVPDGILYTTQHSYDSMLDGYFVSRHVLPAIELRVTQTYFLEHLTLDQVVNMERMGFAGDWYVQSWRLLEPWTDHTTVFVLLTRGA